MDTFIGEMARTIYYCCLALGLLALAFLGMKWLHDTWVDPDD